MRETANKNMRDNNNNNKKKKLAVDERGDDSV
jgi:hypothetical protein